MVVRFACPQVHDLEEEPLDDLVDQGFGLVGLEFREALQGVTEERGAGLGGELFPHHRAGGAFGLRPPRVAFPSEPEEFHGYPAGGLGSTRWTGMHPRHSRKMPKWMKRYAPSIERAPASICRMRGQPMETQVLRDGRTIWT